MFTDDGRDRSSTTQTYSWIGLSWSFFLFLVGDDVSIVSSPLRSREMLKRGHPNPRTTSLMMSNKARTDIYLIDDASLDKICITRSREHPCRRNEAPKCLVFFCLDGEVKNRKQCCMPGWCDIPIFRRKNTYSATFCTFHAIS